MSSGSFIVEFSSNTAAIGAASSITIHHHPLDRVRGPEPHAAVSSMLEIATTMPQAPSLVTSGVYSVLALEAMMHNDHNESG